MLDSKDGAIPSTNRRSLSKSGTTQEKQKKSGCLKTSTKTCIFIILLPFLLLMIGAASMREFEYDLEMDRLAAFEKKITTLEDTIRKVAAEIEDGTIQEQFDDLIGEITPYLTSKASVPSETYPFWDLKGSAYFCWTIMTTIGYGSYTPVSNDGKIFCIFYTFVTVPIFLISLAVASDNLSQIALKMFSICGKETFLARRRVIFVWIVGIFFLFVLSSAYSSENSSWTYLDAVYFSVITLSTVGFGDYTPNLQEVHVFLFILYCCIGMVTIGAMLASLQELLDTKSDNIANRIQDISRHKILEKKAKSFIQSTATSEI